MFVARAPLAVAAGGISDNFNRANAALTTPWVQMCWLGNSFSVASNRVTSGSSSGSYADAYIYNSPLASQTQFAQMTITTIGAFGSFDTAGVVLRAANTTNTALALYGSIYSGSWYIYTNTPGSSNNNTILASGTGSYSSGSILRLEVSGNTATLKYGGTTLGSYTGTLPTGSYAGIQFEYVTSVGDDWSAG